MVHVKPIHKIVEYLELQPDHEVNNADLTIESSCPPSDNDDQISLCNLTKSAQYKCKKLQRDQTT